MKRLVAAIRERLKQSLVRIINYASEEANFGSGDGMDQPPKAR